MTPNIITRLSLCAVFGIVLLLISGAQIRHTGSDPRGTLLVSQTIVQHGTVKLDSYGAELLQSYGYVIHQKNNHYYHYFPIGTALLSTPFVLLANAAGWDMVKHEPAAQLAIAAIGAMLTILLLYQLARLFLPRTESVLLASLFWFGTSFASTTGTALWSHNFASLLALIAIYSSVKSARNDDFTSWPIVATSLFLAYLCRPTMALLAPFVILFLFAHDKRTAIKTALLLTLWLVLFAAFSRHEFGQMLPDYYLPKRLEGGHFAEALFGNLFSPARGLFVLSPILLLPLLFLKQFRNMNKDVFLLFIALAWPVAHLIFVSRFPHWWAGWSFGARFMTDVLPGLFILLCYTLSSLRANRLRAWVFLALTGCFSIFVHSYQGLYNEYTAQWNVEPNIDKYPEYLFDWKYPQFLHNQKRHEKRLIEFRRKEECLSL